MSAIFVLEALDFDEVRRRRKCQRDELV